MHANNLLCNVVFFCFSPVIHPKGKAALIVNTASLCGLTPQLKELEMVHRRFQGKLIVYGLPCNDFGGQEPWEEEKIAKFYKKEFGVTFKLTSKIHVMGPECHSLYSAVHKEYGADACPSWNFHKLLIDQSGDLTGVFGHALSPCEPEVTEAIEDAIKD
jgi:glutathione peroxidase